MTRAHILVVEDDIPIRRGIVDALTFAGFAVAETDSGNEALQMIDESPTELVLLDVMLPDIEGFDVLESLRQSHPSLPVIMLTARGAESDRVRGLEGGADDYVVKPFGARELIARVEAVLRRSPERPTPIHSIETAECRVDLTRRESTVRNESPNALTEREVGILMHLAANRDRAIDRRELLLRVWGVDPSGFETRTVDMHIARLREKLGLPTDETEMILTVRGKGYMLSDSAKVNVR